MTQKIIEITQLDENFGNGYILDIIHASSYSISSKCGYDQLKTIVILVRCSGTIFNKSNIWIFKHNNKKFLSHDRK